MEPNGILEMIGALVWRDWYFEWTDPEPKGVLEKIGAFISKGWTWEWYPDM